MRGVATLQRPWSPCARHEEEEVAGVGVGAWSRKPPSVGLEAPRSLSLQLPLVSYIQMRKLRIH